MARKRGRKAKLPNLKKVDGGFMNQYGVVFSAEQKKALERAVTRSNRRRAKELAAESKKPHMVAGKMLQENKSQLYTMGKENEFIVAHQPRTLQKFESMQEYEKFMDKQAHIQSGEYVRDKARLYKRNFIGALKKVYAWDEVKDIVMKVQMMDPEEYIKMVGRDEVLEIRYAPSDRRVSGRLNQLRTALGMKEKDEWVDETR